MSTWQQKVKTVSNGHKGTLVLAFPPILIIVIAAVLFVMMISVCTKFTKGPLSTSAFLKQLHVLQLKLVLGKKINPEKEREEMERLQNKIKTFSEASIISRNADLQRLLHSICHSIKVVLGQPNLENRTSWIKLNALMVDFNTQYFRGNT